MKLIIAGGRDFNDYELLTRTIAKLCITPIEEIVCGEVRGADSLGKRYANENKITVTSFPADWDLYGKGAGYIRNREMARYATHLIAFWNGKSKGTKSMIELAEVNGLKVRVVKY